MAVTIVELIEEKVGQVTRLQEQIRHLRNALAAENGARATVGSRPTMLELAEVTLKKVRRPMPSREIAEAIEKEHGVHVKPHSLGTMLFRSAIERKQIFYKDKKMKNTYGLLEWQ